MKTLIVDDEFMQSGYLEQQLVKNCPQVDIVQICDDPKEALLFLKKNKLDLIFLDVEMPGMNGFEFIEIAGLENLPPIIFTTAFSEYAVNAFKVNAIDYLLKPVIAEELKEAIEKVQLRIDQPKKLETLIETQTESFEKRLVVVDGNSHVFLKFDEIICIEGNGSYTIFYLTNGKKITASRRLNYYWKKLEGRSFIRPHQSYIANRMFILSYSYSNGGEINLIEEHVVPVSSRLKHSIKSKLGLLEK